MYEVFIPWSREVDSHDFKWTGEVGEHLTWLEHSRLILYNWEMSKEIDEQGYSIGIVFRFENKKDAVFFKLVRG